MQHDTFTFTDTKCLLRNTPIQQYKNFPLLEQPVNHYYIIIIRCLCCVHSYCVVFLDVGEPFAPFKIPEPKKDSKHAQSHHIYNIPVPDHHRGDRGIASGPTVKGSSAGAPGCEIYHHKISFGCRAPQIDDPALLYSQ